MTLEMFDSLMEIVLAAYEFARKNQLAAFALENRVLAQAGLTHKMQDGYSFAGSAKNYATAREALEAKLEAKHDPGRV